MLGIQNLPLFILSGLLLNLIPGPDTLYIVGRSISQGRKAGSVSVLGISTGCAVHTLAAAFGLSAILAASASAFLAVKLAGAVYLGYLGIRMLLDRNSANVQNRLLPAQNLRAIYWQAVITNVLNPKVALFFLSFLPQFVDPARTTRISAFLLLGAVFIFNSTIYCSLVAWFASGISSHLQGTSSSGVVLKRATGALFVGLGLKLAAGK
jgi:threonine/homoserine/homoserine lactone efflux protein